MANKETDLYHIALRALSRIKRRLTIVVVGANDGKINDPVYGFAHERPDRTKMLLVEPNPALLPFLKNNYSTHPDHTIANYAIGKEGRLTLYSIKKEWWDRFQPAYAAGWPAYRAATGIGSATRSHLEKALRLENINPDDAIETLIVPARDLKSLLMEVAFPPVIDVLQIDAEGGDDSVIFASNLNCTKPKLIYFESCNMAPGKLESLTTYLAEHQYKTFSIDENSLAVSTRLDLASLCLRGFLWLHRIRRKWAARSVK